MITYTQRNNQILEEVSTSLFVQKKKFFHPLAVKTHLNTPIMKENKKIMACPCIGLVFFFFVVWWGVDMVNVGKGVEAMVKDTEK